jgi:hypothetical protein
VQQVSPRVANTHTHTKFVSSLLKNFDIERIRNLNIHFFVVVLKLLDIIQPPLKTNKMCIEYARLLHNSVSVVCCGGSSMHTCVCVPHIIQPDRQTGSLLALEPPPPQMGLTVNYLFSCCCFFFFFFPSSWFGIRTRPQQEQQNEKRKRGLLCEHPLLLLTASFGRLYKTSDVIRQLVDLCRLGFSPRSSNGHCCCWLICIRSHTTSQKWRGTSLNSIVMRLWLGKLM